MRLIAISLLGWWMGIAAAAETPAADKLIVHEWGKPFTSFAGSDGVYLDYRTLRWG